MRILLYLLPAISLGITIALLDRLKELTFMKNRLVIWFKFWNIDPLSKVGKWWNSTKSDQLNKWYLWPVRDAYHPFKEIIYIIFLIVMFFYMPFWYWLALTLSFSGMQILFDIILFDIMDKK